MRACGGDGILKIEMHFLPDVYVPCEVCHGKRYNRETLEVNTRKEHLRCAEYDGRGGTGILRPVPSISGNYKTLYECRPFLHPTRPAVHHAVRWRSAAYQARSRAEPPRHGKNDLHSRRADDGTSFADVHKLVEILHRLSEGGNTVVVIEHNLDVIKTADYIIDIGPEGGDGGGTVIACGTPEEVAKSPVSYTGKYVENISKKSFPFKGIVYNKKRVGVRTHSILLCSGVLNPNLFYTNFKQIKIKKNKREQERGLLWLQRPISELIWGLQHPGLCQGKRHCIKGAVRSCV